MNNISVYEFYSSIDEYESRVEQVLFSIDGGEFVEARSPLYDPLLGEIYTWSIEEFDAFIAAIKCIELDSHKLIEYGSIIFEPGAQGRVKGKINLFSANGHTVNGEKYPNDYLLKTYYMEGVYDEYSSIICIPDRDIPKLINRLEATRTRILNLFDEFLSSQSSSFSLNDYGKKTQEFSLNEYGRKLQEEYIKRKEDEAKQREENIRSGKIKPSKAMLGLLSCGIQDLML